ncbi:MAG TPA: hypothetical protein VF582_08830 [Allosphingosinicella sp.]|jgi:hypothetical protein
MSRKSTCDSLQRLGPGSGFAGVRQAAQADRQRAPSPAAIGRALDDVEPNYYYGGLEYGVRRVCEDRPIIANLRDAGAGAPRTNAPIKAPRRPRFTAISEPRCATIVTFAADPSP